MPGRLTNTYYPHFSVSNDQGTYETNRQNLSTIRSLSGDELSSVVSSESYFDEDSSDESSELESSLASLSIANDTLENTLEEDITIGTTFEDVTLGATIGATIEDTLEDILGDNNGDTVENEDNARSASSCTSAQNPYTGTVDPDIECIHRSRKPQTSRSNGSATRSLTSASTPPSHNGPLKVSRIRYGQLSPKRGSGDGSPSCARSNSQFLYEETLENGSWDNVLHFQGKVESDAKTITCSKDIPCDVTNPEIVDVALEKSVVSKTEQNIPRVVPLSLTARDDVSSIGFSGSRHFLPKLRHINYNPKMELNSNKKASPHMDPIVRGEPHRELERDIPCVVPSKRTERDDISSIGFSILGRKPPGQRASNLGVESLPSNGLKLRLVDYLSKFDMASTNKDVSTVKPIAKEIAQNAFQQCVQAEEGHRSKETAVKRENMDVKATMSCTMSFR